MNIQTNKTEPVMEENENFSQLEEWEGIQFYSEYEAIEYINECNLENMAYVNMDQKPTWNYPGKWKQTYTITKKVAK